MQKIGMHNNTMRNPSLISMGLHMALLLHAIIPVLLHIHVHIYSPALPFLFNMKMLLLCIQH